MKKFLVILPVSICLFLLAFSQAFAVRQINIIDSFGKPDGSGSVFSSFFDASNLYAQVPESLLGFDGSFWTVPENEVSSNYFGSNETTIVYSLNWQNLSLDPPVWKPRGQRIVTSLSPTGNPPIIPEPISLSLFLFGGGALAFKSYRNRKKEKRG